MYIINSLTFVLKVFNFKLISIKFVEIHMMYIACTQKLTIMKSLSSTKMYFPRKLLKNIFNKKTQSLYTITKAGRLMLTWLVDNHFAPETIYNIPSVTKIGEV